MYRPKLAVRPQPKPRQARQCPSVRKPAPAHISRGRSQEGRSSWFLSSTGGPSASFRRAVDHILIPYAKATAAEGYRFSPDRFAERFGHTPEELEYIRSALRPGNWRDRSTVNILSGKEEPDNVHKVTKAGKKESLVTDVLWYLQNRAAKFGLI